MARVVKLLVCECPDHAGLAPFCCASLAHIVLNKRNVPRRSRLRLKLHSDKVKGGLSQVSSAFLVRSHHMNIHTSTSRDGTHTSHAMPETMAVKSFEEIPGPKGRALWPTVGAAFLFKPFTSHTMHRPDLLYKDLNRKYGKIVHIRLPFGHTVLLSDPRDMLTVFQNVGKCHLRPNFDLVLTYCHSRQIKTLGTLQGEEWRHLRMRVQPKFMRPGAADPYMNAIGQVADDLVTISGTINPEEANDYRNIIFLYTLECLYQFCFSRRLYAIGPNGISDQREFVRQVRKLISTLASPPLLPLYKLWRTKAYVAVEESMDYLIGLLRQEVKRAIQSAKENKGEPSACPHFISTLLDGSDLTDDEVAVSMSDFFFGGADTSSKNLGVLLFHIASNPEQQELLYEEIKTVVGDGPITKEKMDNMNFAKACVKESFRLAVPVVPGPARYLPEDMVLSGYNVPKGTLVLLNQVAYLHDPQNVKDPQEYRPQRWLRGDDWHKNEAIPNVANLPWGMGLRMCLGKRFAEQIIYLSLIKLVQNFQLQLKVDPSTVNLRYEILPTIDQPLQIKFVPRNGF